MIESNFYAAGILPYTVYNDTIYFLIGKNAYEKTWSDWGGLCEKVIDEMNPLKTAAREFYEETIGSVLSYDEAFSLLNSSNYILVNTESTKGLPYKMYIIKVVYKNYKTYFDKLLSFCNYIKVDKKFTEKSDMMWISADTLLEFSKETSDCECVDLKFREPFLKTVRMYSNLLKNINT